MQLPDYGPDRALRTHLLAAADHAAQAHLEGASAAIEMKRYLPQPIAQALADAGLYRVLTPKRLGGHGADVATFILVIERLARADASAAWCTFISCTSAIVTGYLPETEVKQIFDKPDVKLAGVFAPRGRATHAVRDGVAGYEVTGSWPWGSGSRNADYIGGGCFVMNSDGQPEMVAEGTPNVLYMLLDASQVEIKDTWQVLGLRGTGSNEFAVRNVFVPASRCAALMSDTLLPDPLYKFPVFGLLGVGIASVALGVARTAIDSLIHLATEKTPQGSSRLLAERASTQEHVARCEARLRAARTYLLDAVETAWRASSETGPMSAEHRRDIRLATTFATDEAAAIATRMHRTAGGSAVYDTSPIQRCLRDVHVVTQHMMVSESTYELAGRLFLGLPTNISML